MRQLMRIRRYDILNIFQLKKLLNHDDTYKETRTEMELTQQIVCVYPVLIIAIK